MSGDGIKTCNKCKRDLPFDSFSTVKPGRGDRNNLASRCKECRSAKNLAWHYDNPDRAKANRRRIYERNPERDRQQARKWQAKNPDRHKENYRNWAAQNPTALAARTALYKANKWNATPIWLSDDHIQEIGLFYECAASLTESTGIAHHVDHIFPLKGNGCSGLHVPWNLQILTAFENISKKNKVPTDFSPISYWFE